jgi:hypothetical protein
MVCVNVSHTRQPPNQPTQPTNPFSSPPTHTHTHTHRASSPWRRATCTSCATGECWRRRTAPSSSPSGRTRVRETAHTARHPPITTQTSTPPPLTPPPPPPPHTHTHTQTTITGNPHPEEKGIVRAEVLTAGWVIRPLDPPHCTTSSCTYFSMADLKVRCMNNMEERNGRWYFFVFFVWEGEGEGSVDCFGSRGGGCCAGSGGVGGLRSNTRAGRHMHAPTVTCLVSCLSFCLCA